MWSSGLVNLLQACWNPVPERRPDFDLVQTYLKDLLAGPPQIPPSPSSIFVF
jgi:hypothetical protein